ncbi:MAG: hypothetical protein LC122_12185 [Chitinophagales bacterium]|nr:hypothetical protein [Chitinophagales bacterium]
MEIIKAELEMLADKEKLNSYELFSKSMETSDYDLIIQLFCELMSEANIYIDFEIVIPDIMLDS